MEYIINSRKTKAEIIQILKENISEMPFKDFTYEMFVKWYEEKFEKINFCRRDVGKALSPYFERRQAGKAIMINSFLMILVTFQLFFRWQNGGGKSGKNLFRSTAKCRLLLTNVN